MAKTALTLLQDQVELIRQEAYAAGYAAAMQAIRDFTARPAASATPGLHRGGAAKAQKPATRRQQPSQATTAASPGKGPKPAAGRRARSPGKSPPTRRQRSPRGNNTKLVAEVLKAMPSGTVRPADIRKALQADKGVAMAFTSIRHALGQLATRNEVEASVDGRTWRYVGAGAD